MSLTLIHNYSFCNHSVIFSAPVYLCSLRHYTPSSSSNCFHTAILCQQYLQYVEKTWSSVHKFKHEDYKGLVRQVLAYPATYKPLSRVMKG